MPATIRQTRVQITIAGVDATAALAEKIEEAVSSKKIGLFRKQLGLTPADIKA